MKKSLCFAVVGFVVFVCCSATARVLVYEPFDYPDGWLNGQGGALGTIATWASTDTSLADGWRVHPEGELTGIVVDPDPDCTPNVFDGTVDNLPTSGGFAGMAGPEDRGVAPCTDQGTGNLDASIGLDPSVTATFQSGTVTWFSFVSVHAWDRNQGAPQFMIGTDTTTGGSRGLTMVNAGNGIGGGGGPPRFNLQDIYPQFFRDGINNHTPGGYQNDSGVNGGGTFGLHDGIQLAFGSGNDNTSSGTLDEIGQPRTQTMEWVRDNPDGSFGAVNIVVGKIEWDADTGGEDIITLVRFLETDVLSEAAFDAQIALLPALSSKNWASNKPNLDQSQFDTLNFSSLKFFVDEIRLATTFGEVVSISTGDSAPFVDAGIDMITWSGQAVQLDPNVVNNDPRDPQTPLTYLWTAAPDEGVEFNPDEFVEAPAVTITKATDNPSIVTLTLSVNNVGSGKDDVVDAMTIDVYDDACEAAIGTGLTANNPADLDRNCIIDFDDFALMATTWLDDNSLTVPVPK